MAKDAIIYWRDMLHHEIKPGDWVVQPESHGKRFLLIPAQCVGYDEKGPIFERWNHLTGKIKIWRPKTNANVVQIVPPIDSSYEGCVEESLKKKQYMSSQGRRPREVE